MWFIDDWLIIYQYVVKYLSIGITSAVLMMFKRCEIKDTLMNDKENKENKD